ncbi:efflux RND transporter periplasmic adaptor subunit [Tamlana sp. 62-3]|uniref:Efflux RND transporter periplasmic adaptor subunit n=1 Tax=Neotamlana sargassicola TaxID=2883125 RepID=A0A9X1L6V3_9FLAO|nr:efflux RND transporter periplasmic adaptor subunit [Tamlana sargassicola]MCB4807934.1 efflux RND transporter periplasmic adaptor subunit [Tamlana sargassicola]
MKKNHMSKAVKSLMILILLICFNCTQKKDKPEEEEFIDKKAHGIQKNEVSVALLEQKPFKRELVSNGKLIAIQKNVLKFEVGERLEKLYVANGDLVKKGQTLAVLKPYKFKQKLDKATISLKKATLDFKDQLLGRGYDYDVKDSIPKNIYEMVAIRSGYDDALRDLEDAKYELRSSKLVAPFSGRVANIESKQFEQVSVGRDFMTLINDSTFEVEFHLIESEVGDVRVNDQVEIVPFALEKTYQGKITTINPIVEKNGTILVKALVKNDGQLIEGMNVKVLIQKDIPDQLVVPKEAVILRQNQEVLFKVVDGRAFWTYVLTTNENSKHYAVIPHPDKSSAKLTPGDSIIVSGNLNLAHDSEVVVKK